MKKIIAGATGFIGQCLVNKWLLENTQITVIGRSEEKIRKLFGKNVKALSWQNFATDGLTELHDANIIVNLSGENIGSKRWTEKRKQEILESRIQTTQLISNLCSILGDKSPPWFNASAVGVYGLQRDNNKELPSPFDETTVINFDKAPDFLAKVARHWEQQTNQAKAHGVRVINMRFGVVLGAGGALERIATPFKLFMGGPIGSGNQPFPWIHMTDVFNIIDFLTKHSEINGAVNFVAPESIKQSELAKALGHVLNRPSCMHTPSVTLKLAFGEMADELLLHGQNVFPKVLLDAGFKFQYPNIQSALAHIYKN